MVFNATFKKNSKVLWSQLYRWRKPDPEKNTDIAQELFQLPYDHDHDGPHSFY